MPNSSLSLTGQLIGSLGITNISGAYPPNPNAPGTTATVSVTTTATSITIPTGTKAIVIQNLGPSSVGIGPSSVSTLANMIVILPNQAPMTIPVDTSSTSGIGMVAAASQGSSVTIYFL